MKHNIFFHSRLKFYKKITRFYLSRRLLLREELALNSHQLLKLVNVKMIVINRIMYQFVYDFLQKKIRDSHDKIHAINKCNLFRIDFTV